MARGDWGGSINLTSTSLGTDGETERNNKEQKTENHDKSGRSSFPALPHSDCFLSFPAELQRIQSTESTVEDARAPADQRWGADDYSMTQDKKATLGINYNTFRRSIKKKKNPLLNKKEEKKIQAWWQGAGYWWCNRRLYVELICAEKKKQIKKNPCLHDWKRKQEGRSKSWKRKLYLKVAE